MEFHTRSTRNPQNFSTDHRLRVIWRRGHIPPCWHVADGCFVPKEEKLKEIKHFRTISLLNVEGKIFSTFTCKMDNALHSGESILGYVSSEKGNSKILETLRAN